MSELARDVRLHGYYGGIRLLKAAVKRFHDYCGEKGILLDDRNFTLRYESSIPTQVGLAGSSAIITACFRALMAFHGVDIPRPVLANLILSVENAELRIPAGLQDRVVMVTRHCLRFELGWCQAHPNPEPWKQLAEPAGPLFLENGETRLECLFDCARCRMELALRARP